MGVQGRDNSAVYFRIKGMLKIYFYFIVFLTLMIFPGKIFSQEVNIVPYLKQIESGDLKDAKEGLAKLLKEHPFDPSVMFLDGVLTQNAQDALATYNKIINKYPGSKYADAAMYRIYAYYYALGFYDTANSYLERLKAAYPGSPYLKIINKDINTEKSLQDEKSTGRESDYNITGKTKESNEADNKGDIFDYTIQAGAFSSKDNALSLQKDLVDAGYYAILKEKSVAGSIFQVVYVGKFKNEVDAKNTLQEIETKFNIEGQVVPVE